MQYFFSILTCICMVHPFALHADLASLLGGTALQGTRTSVMQKPTGATIPDGIAHDGSLFAGKGGLGLFAPHPVRQPRTAQPLKQFTPASLPHPNSAATHIRHIISQAEAGSNHTPSRLAKFFVPGRLLLQQDWLSF